jgi:phosphopantothenoylcysteine decarboxylase/phosphopantothenate--cysteine ligase
MLEPSALLSAIQSLSAPKSLQGKRALVTAGPTFEPIDPVRGITNSSSGKMGYAIAQALLDAGASVTLVSGPTAINPPPCAKLVRVTTASQMFAAVKANLSDVELFFGVAAVADYTPSNPQPQKMKKKAEKLTLELVPTADILAWVASRPQPPFCVGFAAESNNVIEYARKKRKKKGIPLIVANLASAAIGSNDNSVTILDDSGDYPIPHGNKADVARAIVEHASKLFKSFTRKQTKKRSATIA